MFARLADRYHSGFFCASRPLSIRASGQAINSVSPGERTPRRIHIAESLVVHSLVKATCGLAPTGRCAVRRPTQAGAPRLQGALDLLLREPPAQQAFARLGRAFLAAVAPS